MNKNYKVLFVSHFSGINGAPKSMINLITELEHYGVTSYVVIPGHGQIERFLKMNHIKYFIIDYLDCYYNLRNKVPYLKLLQTEIHNLKATLKIIEIIRNNKIDIVHSNSFAVDVGAMAACISKRPHVWHIREFMEEDFGFTNNIKSKDIWLARKSFELIAVSNAVRDKYRNSYGLKNIRTVYNGFTIDDYNYDKKQFFDNDKLRLLIAGNICIGKGHRDAIYACKHLVSSGYDQFILYIAGRGEVKYINSLKRLVTQMGIEPYVKFIGFQEDLKSIRKDIDIELVCSVSEGFGRVTIEAMLSDVLVIGANTGGTKELIKDNWNGLLYEQGNPKNLAHKINIVRNNKDKYRRCILTAKRFALDNFSIEYTAKGVMNTYDRLLANKR